jgi:hypothetical protein
MFTPMFKVWQIVKITRGKTGLNPIDFIVESVVHESDGRSKSRQDHEWAHDLSHEGM